MVRELFGLSNQEEVLDHFNCALKGSINLRGRLFCTDNYVCFYANILGFKTKEVVPLTSIQALEKLGPRDILLQTNKRKYLFTGLNIGNEAFPILRSLWRNCEISTADYPEDTQSLCSPEEQTKEISQETVIALMKNQEKTNVFETIRAVLPMTTQQFFDLFYADNAPFGLKIYFESREDSEIDISPWSPTPPDDCLSRILRFRTKIKGQPIGPKSTRCEVTQYCWLRPDSMQVKQTCRALDVPFSACFAVEQEWGLRFLTQDKVILRVTGVINFLKSTMFRGMIESKSKQDLIKDNENWLKFMREKGAFPSVSVVSQTNSAPTEAKRHNVARYGKATLHSPVYPKRSMSLKHLSVVTTLGVVFLLLYLCFLHVQISSVS